MRKWGVLAITATMLLTLSSPLNAAAPKAGAKCSKAGATSISAGKKFTCVKSGTKLVWNKGVVVKKPAPVSTVSPTPSPIPTATPSITPTPSATPTPKAPTSFDDLVENYQGIAYAAWSKSREKILASTKTDITLKMIMGPTSQLTYKEPLIPIDLVSRMYAGNVEPIEIYYLAFNYADREWAVNQMESILPNSGSRWVTDVACRTQATCWGGGSFYNGSNRYLIVLAVELQTPEHMNGTVEAHEFTHTVQQMNIKKGRPAQEFLYDPWPPTWYWEGQAHFTQHAAVFYDSFADYMKFRKNTSSDLYTNQALNSQYLENYFVFNAPDAWQKNYERWYQYSIGARFVEILTALKGPDSTMEMWKIASTGVDFKSAFEKVYGISFDKAMPIMAKAIALELGRS